MRGDGGWEGARTAPSKHKFPVLRPEQLSPARTVQECSEHFFGYRYDRDEASAPSSPPIRVK